VSYSEDLAAKIVTGFYRGYLKREPDPAGLKYWLERIIEDGNLTETIFSFLESEEYIHKHKQELFSSQDLVKSITRKIDRTICILDIGAILIGSEKPLWDSLAEYSNLEVIGFDPQIESSNQVHQKAQYSVAIKNYGFALGDGEEHHLHINNEVNTSSFYPLFDNKSIFHLNQLYTEKISICPTKRLDDIGLPLTIDLLKIDVQGYELEILQHGLEVLKSTNLVYIEVAFRPIYAGQPLFAEIDIFMRDSGFSLVDLHNVRYPMLGTQNDQADLLIWADALYQREPNDMESSAIQNLILLKVFDKVNLAEYRDSKD